MLAFRLDLLGHAGSVGTVEVRELRLEGPSMQLPEGQVARYHGGMWTSAELAFILAEVDSPVLLRFESQDRTSNGSGTSITRGPFAAVRIVDGAIRCGEAWREMIAHFDAEAGLWVDMADQTPWPVVVLASS